jgi:hypothetical protein
MPFSVIKLPVLAAYALPGTDLSLSMVRNLQIEDRVMLEIAGEEVNPGRLNPKAFHSTPWHLVQITNDDIVLAHADLNQPLRLYFKNAISEEPLVILAGVKPVIIRTVEEYIKKPSPVSNYKQIADKLTHTLQCHEKKMKLIRDLQGFLQKFELLDSEPKWYSGIRPCEKDEQPVYSMGFARFIARTKVPAALIAMIEIADAEDVANKVTVEQLVKIELARFQFKYWVEQGCGETIYKDSTDLITM